MRLVYFSPLPWVSFAQRPHRFVEWFHAKKGGEVLWVDPYPTRLPNLSDIRRLKLTRGNALASGETEYIPEWLTILRPRALPIEPLPGGSLLNGLLWKNTLQTIDRFLERSECLLCIGKPSELALNVLTQHRTIPSLYDAMDDFPAFYKGISRAAMRHREKAILASVTRISVSSSVLADRFADYHHKSCVVFNACSTEMLPPPEAKNQNPAHPIVLGYVGTIGSWFDWNLVFALAEANPDAVIRLIGPAHVVPSEPLPCNIELLPACDHEAAIKAMQNFSAGLIPFKSNNLTASVDPIKYYEYRALGLPVISSRFGEMSLREMERGVFLIRNDSDLTNVVQTAMAYTCAPTEMQSFREANSWRVRFDTSGILP